MARTILRNVVKLRDICDITVVRNDLRADQPKKGMTWCNKAVSEIAYEYLGLTRFKGFLANEIMDDIGHDDWWFPVEGRMASRLAWFGFLCIAGQKKKGHGHVAVVYPSERMKHSAKWNKEVPLLANVGPERYTGIVGTNMAFGKEPKYFAYMKNYREDDL